MCKRGRRQLASVMPTFTVRVQLSVIGRVWLAVCAMKLGTAVMI
jgi:hypothetical protein